MYEYACAHILLVPFTVSLGWFQNDARAEPGSWLVIGSLGWFQNDASAEPGSWLVMGMILVFD